MANPKSLDEGGYAWPHETRLSETPEGVRDVRQELGTLQSLVGLPVMHHAIVGSLHETNLHDRVALSHAS